jgi:5'-phosphate synthase pdxT subunit
MPSAQGPTIGVLALQGGYEAHQKSLVRLGSFTRYVRVPEDLEGLDGIILPGGESTTIGKLMDRYKLLEPLKEKILNGFPVFATCAGLILLSEEVVGRTQHQLGVLNTTVDRNAYGRQIESFETTLEVKLQERTKIPAIFIRAPRITHFGKHVETLAIFEGSPVMVRQNNILAASFHPELTDSDKVHSYFLQDFVVKTRNAAEGTQDTAS